MIRKVRIKIYGVLAVLLLGTLVEARGQDPQFTQFFANPLYLAPSYAGASQGHRAVLSYRDQWSFVPNMYRQLSVSYDVNIASLRSGVGVFVLGDVAGDGFLGTILAGLVYSYSVEMTPEWSFRPGIGLYYTQLGVNYSRLVFGDQLNTDPVSPETVQTAGKGTVFDIDFSTSVLFHSANSWAGFTMDHILRPKNSFYDKSQRKDFKFTLFGGHRFVIHQLYRRGVDQSVTVTGTLRNQGKHFQLDIGGYWFRYPLIVGVWYRGLPFIKETYFGSDAVSFMAGCRFNAFQVVYSYDLTVSTLTPASGGSHEISLTYEAKVKKKKRGYRAPVCPPY